MSPGRSLRRAAISSTVALCFVSACDSGPVDPEPITELPRQLTVDERQLVASSNRFTFELAHAVTAPDSSFFLSPLSASFALGMALNGAGGETWNQMRATLGLDGLTQTGINQSYRSLLELLLMLDPAVDVAIGNSMWMREGFEPYPAFVDTVRTYFGAEVATLDFADPSASGRINAWVDDATDGRITGIVPDPLPSSTLMYLINAIFFEGGWTDEFDPDRTGPAPFRRADGSTVDVDLMHRPVGPVSYASGPGYTVADLPYGGGAFSMTIVLPNAIDGVEAVLDSLDPESWGTIVDGLSEREVQLSLPRFEMRYARTLNDDLRDLGMVDAFLETADFSRLSDLSLLIEDVRQKAYVRVDEQGTTAAAVTSVGIGPTSAPPSFRVDSPFVFAIRERLTGTILFLGKVVDPSR